MSSHREMVPDYGGGGGWISEMNGIKSWEKISGSGVLCRGWRKRGFF